MELNAIYINGETTQGDLFWYGANNLPDMRVARRRGNTLEVRLPTNVIRTIFGNYYLQTPQGDIRLRKKRESSDGRFLSLPPHYFLFNPSKCRSEAA